MVRETPIRKASVLCLVWFASSMFIFPFLFTNARASCSIVPTLLNDVWSKCWNSEMRLLFLRRMNPLQGNSPCFQRLSTTLHHVARHGLSQRQKRKIKVMHILVAYFVYQVSDLRRKREEKGGGGRGGGWGVWWARVWVVRFKKRKYEKEREFRFMDLESVGGKMQPMRLEEDCHRRIVH